MKLSCGIKLSYYIKVVDTIRRRKGHCFIFLQI